MAKWSLNCTNCGYYSFPVGSFWHVLALNTNCTEQPSAPCTNEATWVQGDLAGDASTCEIAFGHHPRFSSTLPSGNLSGIFTQLYNGGVDLFLSAHAHYYERFDLVDPNNVADPSGVRQMVVGTGGKNLVVPGTPIANVQRQLQQFGVLKLELSSTSYTMTFLGEGGSVLDGPVTRSCH